MLVHFIRYEHTPSVQNESVFYFLNFRQLAVAKRSKAYVFRFPVFPFLLFYFIKVIKSRGTRWVGHMTHMGEMRNAYKSSSNGRNQRWKGCKKIGLKGT
jgi:hypothetical protein